MQNSALLVHLKISKEKINPLIGAAGVSAPGDRIRTADLALQLVEVASRGLRAQAVEATDFDPLLQVIVDRAHCGQTGAVWQRRMLELFESGQPRETALAALV